MTQTQTARHYGISRQAVHKAVKKGYVAMNGKHVDEAGAFALWGEGKKSKNANTISIQAQHPEPPREQRTRTRTSTSKRVPEQSPQPAPQQIAYSEEYISNQKLTNAKRAIDLKHANLDLDIKRGKYISKITMEKMIKKIFGILRTSLETPNIQTIVNIVQHSEAPEYSKEQKINYIKNQIIEANQKTLQEGVLRIAEIEYEIETAETDG